MIRDFSEIRKLSALRKKPLIFFLFSYANEDESLIIISQGIKHLKSVLKYRNVIGDESNLLVAFCAIGIYLL